MRFVFRVDASLQIGTGHLMRCLALAERLKNSQAEISFICRENIGTFKAKITEKGFRLIELKSFGKVTQEDKLFHSKWLSVTQKEDANQCKPILEKIYPDWLIVDHYALDDEWESEVKQNCKRLMVIDDLADRNHICDLLLDQSFGRIAEHYSSRVPKFCKLLTGSEYCLLRPEFAQWRSYSLARRSKATFKNLLVTMGGVDLENHTEDILIQLSSCVLPEDIRITIVLGSQCPHIERVKMIADCLRQTVIIEVDVDNMAEIMANSDIAIGAAGTTSWERCCLGLPTIQIVLAENQKFLAEKLSKINASVLVDGSNTLESVINKAPRWMSAVSLKSAGLTDGSGASVVARHISELS